MANERTTAAWDSGGPPLHNGRFLGVLTGGLVRTQITGTGDASWWTGPFNPSRRNFIETETDGRVRYDAQSVPLPSSLVLLIAGLVGLYLTVIGTRRERATRGRA
ncbi:hypothetical protein QWY84_06010 [Aquisalimonas lutea]|uniref:hypothetical protein n=1 Tax=Aquisalimonas lutea TaxID=1327750 RepID=UPI0025B2C63B|nr:hypothetical protein [Aquisalimonas lutea]MDN3517159.1 hypothetical protein [Aquisalimonas lutea]